MKFIKDCLEEIMQLKDKIERADAILIGANTSAIIKYPFWQMTEQYPNATYACINLGECYLPEELKGKSIGIDSDIAKVLATI